MEDKSIRDGTGRFDYTEIIILFVMLLRLSHMGVYFRSQSAYACF